VSDIVGVLLAAGAARRFGSPKLLQPLPDGTPVGVAAARPLRETMAQVIAVVRPGDRALREALAAVGVEVVENPLADEGIGTSLAAGIGATANAGGWLVALADMPWVAPATVQALADRLRAGASMVAPLHGGRRGHPVGFAGRWGGALQALRGDEGARGLLAAHAAELVLLATGDAGVLADVDHPGDLVGVR